MSSILDFEININGRARQLLSSGKILADIRIESENTSLIIVEKGNERYFMRFIGSKCYALSSLKECNKVPMKTCYNDCEMRYAMYGFKTDTFSLSDSDKSIVCESNIVDYLVDSCKMYIQFYKSLYVYDKVEEEIVCKINKQQCVIYCINKTYAEDIVKLLLSVCSEFGINSSNRALSIQSNDNDIYIADTSKNKTVISESRYIDDINSMITKLENITRSELESIVFCPSRSKNPVYKAYYRKSTVEEGKVRVILTIGDV